LEFLTTKKKYFFVGENMFEAAVILLNLKFKKIIPVFEKLSFLS
jgi:hypothetical protein